MARLKPICKALAAIGLMTASMAVQADPISLLASAIVTGFELTGLQAFAVFAGASLLSTSIAKKKARKARAAQVAAYNASLQDRTTQFSSTEAVQRLLYGSPAPVAGNIVANFVSGSTDQYRHLVIDLASHESDAIEKIYCDGIDIGPLDSNGWVTQGEFWEAPPAPSLTQRFFSYRPNYQTDTFTGASVVLSEPPVTGSVFAYRNVVEEGEAESRISTVEVPVTVSGATVTCVNVADHGFEKFVTYTKGTPSARLRVSLHLSPGGVDTADPYLMAEVPALWTAAHKLSGHTYAVVTFDLRMSRFQGGPGTMTFKLRGKKVYDPRTSLTAYSANPALCLMDYLRTEHGGNTPLAAFDASWISAANACDAAVYPAAENTGNSTELFRCDGVVSLDQGRETIIEGFEAACSGDLSETAGLYRLRVGVWSPPVLSLTDADAFGFVEQVQGGEGLEACFNGARGSYLQAAGLGATQDAKPFSNAAFLAADDGQPRITDLLLGMIGTEQRAQHALRIKVERSRAGLTYKLPVSSRCWPLQPGDRITWTYSPYGIVAQPFRVTSWTQSLAGSPAIEITQDYPEIWDLADATSPYPQPATGLSNGLVVSEVPLLATPQSGTDHLLIDASGSITTRVLLSWPAATDLNVLYGGWVEIEFRPVNQIGDQWQAAPTLQGNATSSYVLGMRDGLHYQFRVRFVNQRGIAGPDAIVTHQVVGKTEPPPAMQDFQIAGSALSWSPPTNVPDLAGARLRFHYGSNIVWASAAPLHEGLITESPWQPPAAPGGPITIMGKLVDTSGNESLEPAIIFTDLGDPLLANVVQTIDFDALAYPGERIGCALSGGDLLADVTTAGWPADPALPDDPPDAVSPAWQALSYTPMAYTSDPFDISAALAGSLATLSANTAGDGLIIEYRRWGASPGWPLGASDPDDPPDPAAPAWPANAPWQPWPGQLQIENGSYQLRVSLGGGAVQGRINALAMVIDAPDYTYSVNNLSIAIGGTVIPLPVAPAKLFTSVQNIAFSLQAATSGAVGLTIDKSNPLVPVARAINGAGTAVAGASADFTLKGY